MNNEKVKYVIFLIGVGIMMVTYVNASHKDFITKDFFNLVLDRLERIENKIGLDISWYS